MRFSTRAALAATLVVTAGWLSACSGTDTTLTGWNHQPGPDPSQGDDSGSSNPGDDSGGNPNPGDDGGNPNPPPPGQDASTQPPPPGQDSGGPPPAHDSGMPPPNNGFDQFQNHNLDVVNMYRATLGVPPLTLDHQLCTFAQAGSVELSQDHTPHQHFITAGNNGTLWTSGFMNGAAENQGDPNGWFVMSPDPTTNEMMQIDDIQKAMFNEGPGPGEPHGHYTNMMNAQYKRLGVGLLEVSGKLYLTNDFSN